MLHRRIHTHHPARAAAAAAAAAAASRAAVAAAARAAAAPLLAAAPPRAAPRPAGAAATAAVAAAATAAAVAPPLSPAQCRGPPRPHAPWRRRTGGTDWSRRCAAWRRPGPPARTMRCEAGADIQARATRRGPRARAACTRLELLLLHGLPQFRHARTFLLELTSELREARGAVIKRCVSTSRVEPGAPALAFVLWPCRP